MLIGFAGAEIASTLLMSVAPVHASVRSRPNAKLPMREIT